jgi:hypothetical protein
LLVDPLSPPQLFTCRWPLARHPGTRFVPELNPVFDCAASRVIDRNFARFFTHRTGTMLYERDIHTVSGSVKIGQRSGPFVAF